MTNREAARKNLIKAVSAIVKTIGPIIESMQRRDPNEPHKREKEEAEARIAAIVRRALQKQAEFVRWQFENQYPDRKAVITPKIDLSEWEEDDINDLIWILTKAAKNGILLFGTGKPVINYSLVNTQAAHWARDYAYELVKGINDVTMKAIQDAVSTFVETPGFTIGDLMNHLPFDEVRAQRVAVTETTRSYAQGQQLAGEELKREFPDVAVVKMWMTNNDSLVCEICGPLDGEEVEIDEEFTPGIDNPPAHPSCRCWTDSRTRI